MSVFVIEMDPYDPAAGVRKRVCFSSNLPDEAALGLDVPYPVRLRQDFRYESSVFSNNLPGAAQASIGTININNADGLYDYLLRYEWGAAPIVIKKGFSGSAYSSFGIFFSGSVLEISADQTNLTIILRDVSWKLVDPLQKNKYLGTGSVEGTVQLRDRPKPLCFGLCENLTPVQVDPILLTYQYHDGPVESVLGAYDDGVPITLNGQVTTYAALINATVPPGTYMTCPSLGFLRLGAPAEGAFTVDVRGQFYASVNASETLRQVLLARTQLVASDVDAGSFAELSADVPYRVSGLYYSSPEIQVDAFMEEVLGGIDAFHAVSSDSKIVARKFKFRVPTTIINALDVSGLQRIVSPKPVYKVTALYRKNMTVQDLSSFSISSEGLNSYLSNENFFGPAGTVLEGVMNVFLGSQQINSLDLVSFQKLTVAPWLTITQNGSFSIIVPDSGTHEVKLAANFNETSVVETLRVRVSTSGVVLSSPERLIRVGPDGSFTDVGTRTFSLARAGDNSTPTFTARDNNGNVIPVVTTGDSGNFAISSLRYSANLGSVTVTATMASGNTDTLKFAVVRVASNLATSIAAALANVGQIGSDNVLARGEKPQLYREYQNAYNMATRAIITAASIGVISEKNNCQVALENLTAFLNNLSPSWTDSSVDTPIPDAGAFQNVWVAFYAALAILMAKIDLEASKTADWNSVYGVGRPESYATYNPNTSLVYSMDYLNLAEFERDWSHGYAGEVEIVTTNDTGGKAVQFGNNSGNDRKDLVSQKLLPYSAEDLYEVMFDLEVFVPGRLDYLGLIPINNNNQQIVGSDAGAYCYVAKASATTVGRATYRGYVRGVGVVGTGAFVGMPASLPSAPSTLPVGTVAVQLLALLDENGIANRSILHYASIRKVEDLSGVATGLYSATRKYRRGETVVSAEGRSFVLVAASALGITPPTTATSNSTWVLIADKGKDGEDGTDGAAGGGSSGLTFYTHIAYANSSDGTVDFSTGIPGGRAFIGLSANNISATESTIPSNYTWSAYKGPASFGLVEDGAIVVASNRLISTNTSGAWDSSSVYSSEGFTGSCSLSFRVDQTNAHCMGGLNTDPVTDRGYISLDYAFYLSNIGTWMIFESGNNVMVGSGYDINTIFQVIYDGKTVRYFVNSVLARSVPVTEGIRFWFDSAFISGAMTVLGWVRSGEAGVDGTNGTNGTNGINGQKGEDGIQYYTHIAYSNAPNGSVDFTTGAPGNRGWQGILSNQLTAVESQNPAAYTWLKYTGPTAYGLVAQNTFINGNLIIKDPAVGAGWGNGGAYADTGFANGAYMSFKWQGDSEFMAGLNADPAASADYADIDFCFYLQGNGTYCDVRIAGATYAVIGGFSGEWVWSIQYDAKSGYVYWFINGGQVASYQWLVGQTLWFDSSIQSAGGRFLLSGYGPAGSSGLNGTNGTNGTNGATGNKFVPVYKRASNTPATPTGTAVPPSGWLTFVPSPDGNILYTSTVEVNPAGVAVGAFTLPVASEVSGANGGSYPPVPIFQGRGDSTRVSGSGSVSAQFTGTAFGSGTVSYTLAAQQRNYGDTNWTTIASFSDSGTVNDSFSASTSGGYLFPAGIMGEISFLLTVSGGDSIDVIPAESYGSIS